MELWQALVLGLVEGLTEYLPVSSTGHLLVAERLLGLPQNEASNAFAIAIQLGAIAAVLGLYRERVGAMLAGVMGRDSRGAHLARMVLVAFLPAAVLGLALDDLIESVLFGPWPIVVAWTAGGILMLVHPALRRKAGEGSDFEALTTKQALLVGLAQCLAMWPGVSRSFATILGGLVVGLSVRAAVELSFLLGVVTLGAATAYAIVKHGGEMLAAYGIASLAVGFVAAFVSAVVSVRFMVRWLETRSLAMFAVWRLVAAALVASLLLTGRL